MKIKLFYSDHNDSKFIASIVSQELKNAGFELSEKEYDIGIAIGGDGTFLHMVSESNFDENIKYVGINNGTLGFLQEVKPNELTSFIKDLKNNIYKVEKNTYEEIKIKTTNGEHYFNALNEVVIREYSLKTAYLEIKIDDTLLENYVGDGIMISTPIGSTAYNLSSNGSIIYNSLRVLEITPIAPINNYIYRTLSNSIIIPDDKIIRIKPVKRTESIGVFIDGVNYEFPNVEEIEIKVSEKNLKIIRLKDFNYTDIIFNKFLK